MYKYKCWRGCREEKSLLHWGDSGAATTENRAEFLRETIESARSGKVTPMAWFDEAGSYATQSWPIRAFPGSLGGERPKGRQSSYETVGTKNSYFCHNKESLSEKRANTKESRGKGQ